MKFVQILLILYEQLIRTLVRIMSQINRKDDSTGAEQGLSPFALINRPSDKLCYRADKYVTL